MPECSYCNQQKPTGKTDGDDSFWCDECIDDEDMQTCEDCEAMFPSSDMARGSAPRQGLQDLPQQPDGQRVIRTNSDSNAVTA